VTDVEVAELAPQVPDWDMVTEEGIRKLDRVFRFKDFEQALSYHPGSR
jgi:4a-hydroxytetrahydrobiopterin dehydratase